MGLPDQLDEVLFGSRKVFAFPVAGIHGPVGMLRQGIETNAAVLMDLHIILTDQCTAEVVGYHLEDGHGTGGFKGNLRPQAVLSEDVLLDLAQGRSFAHHGKGLVLQPFQRDDPVGEPRPEDLPLRHSMGGIGSEILGIQKPGYVDGIILSVSAVTGKDEMPEKPDDMLKFYLNCASEDKVFHSYGHAPHKLFGSEAGPEALKNMLTWLDLRA